MLSRLTQAKEKIRWKKHGHSQKGENAAQQDYKQPAERAGLLYTDKTEYNKFLY
ncbi:hypothetical protein RSAG8_12398, partial [Rhizoctonia solani AG-8 WAC10335]